VLKAILAGSEWDLTWPCQEYVASRCQTNFGYRCFDRILLNGLIQPFQQPERVSVSSTPIVRASESRATVCSILPSNLATGLKIGPKNGARPSWKRRREDVMTLSIATFEEQKPMR
jgi:hypothetical protein